MPKLLPSKRMLLFSNDENIPSTVACKRVSDDYRAVKDNLQSHLSLKSSYPELINPIHRNYEFPLVDGDVSKPAMQHQKDGAAFVLDHVRSWNTSEMGTGKTLTMLYAADYGMQEGVFKRVLIFSKLSTLWTVWDDSIKNTFGHRNYTVDVLHGTPEQREKIVKSKPQFLIVNHEIALSFLDMTVNENKKRNKGRTFVVKPLGFFIQDFDLIIFDESTCLKTESSYIFNYLKLALRKDQRLILLTGTPVPNANTDCYHPATLVNPSSVPKYFSHFRKDVMYSEMRGGFEKWSNRKDEFALKAVYNALQPMFRVFKADVLDLPPVVFERVEVEMSAEQKTLYQKMLKDMIIEDGKIKITAQQVTSRISKLHQILCGCVKVDTGGGGGDDDCDAAESELDLDTDTYLNSDLDLDTSAYYPINCKPRVEATIEYINKSLSKVVVVVPFKGALYELEKELLKHFRCRIINGDVAPKKRKPIIDQFKNDPDCKVLIVHPKVISHGETLVVASTMIFFSAIDGNEMYRQILERLPRPGQKHNMTVVQLGSKKLEWDKYSNLDEKEQTQQSVLMMYKSVLNE